MIDARHYSTTETLRNGLEVCVRAIRPDDWDMVVEAFHKLDSESIYTRFFSYKKLSDNDRKTFCETDFDHRVTLIVTLIADGREIVIASAVYVRSGVGVAEVAFTVEEDYHRLGIARRLLSHLGRIAVDAGISTFVAEVLPQNLAMLKVFSACGWPVTTKNEDGTVHVTISLPTAATG